MLLLVLLTPFALRGYFRGFCRESLGLLGLIGGVLAAAAFGSLLSGALLGWRVPAPIAAPAAFAAIFLGVTTLAMLVGMVADRLVRALLLGGVNRAAGAAFGSAKGATVLVFVLLLAHRLVPSPSFTEVLDGSRIGRPLMSIASTVLEAGRGLAESPARRTARNAV